MITRTCELKTLTKCTSCKCKCNFDGKNITRIKSGKTINASVDVKIQQ